MRIFVTVDCSRGYNRSLLRGLTRYAKSCGSWAFFYPPQFWETGSSPRLNDYLRSRKIDGVIAVEQGSMKGLLETGLPTVISPSSGEYYEGMINLTTDHRSIGKLAAEHLLECSFKYFAFAGYNNQF